MAGYATRVRRDIDRWIENGLIDAATGHALALDVDTNAGSRFSFGTVLSLMAATLFGAAILLVVAANWEAIPRVTRVALLFATIFCAYVGGAVLKERGSEALGEGAWLLAATAFGGSIALIGQMYHLSGDEKQAIFIWGAGTALAAVALRSWLLTIGAVLLAIVWMVLHALEYWSSTTVPIVYPIVAMVLFAVSMWTDSRLSRYLLVLSLFVYASILYWESELDATPIALCAVSVAAFAAARFAPERTERLVGLRDDLLVLSLLGFLVGVGMLQIAYADEPEFLVASIAAFAGVVGALLMGGAQSAWLRRLAYAAFLFQLGFIYVVMLGTMLGTAGFFVIGGLVLLVLAWLIRRLEKRFAAASDQEGGGR